MFQLLQGRSGCGILWMWALKLSKKLTESVLDISWQLTISSTFRTENIRDVERNRSTPRGALQSLEHNVSRAVDIPCMLLCRVANQCKGLIHVGSLADSSFDSYFDTMLHLDPKQSHLSYPDADHAPMRIPPDIPTDPCGIKVYQGQSINCGLERRSLGPVRWRWFYWKHYDTVFYNNRFDSARAYVCTLTVFEEREGSFASHLMWKPVGIVWCQDGRE